MSIWILSLRKINNYNITVKSIKKYLFHICSV